MKPTFENLKFDPLYEKNIYVSNNECDGDTNYFSKDDLKEMSKTVSKNFNMLNANIRSLYSKFESLKDFLRESGIHFNIKSLVETWLKDRPYE